MTSTPSGGTAKKTPSVDVVICAYTEDRWYQLTDAVRSVMKQTSQAQRILLVIDHNEQLLDRCRAEFASEAAEVVPNRHERGLSGARNTGVEESTSEVIAFLDDDATADADWLLHFRRALRQDGVVGVGGKVEPQWVGGEPSWFPAEFKWVVGCSYQGLPTVQTAVRNPIGASMAFSAEALKSAGGFDAGLGRIGKKPVGCEETELSLRVRDQFGPESIQYVPSSLVQHFVAAERGTLRYFVERCWSEGQSKAVVAARAGASEALDSERRYVRSTLPIGVAKGLRRPLVGWAQAAMIFVGLCVTGLGYGMGRLRRQRSVVSAR